MFLEGEKKMKTNQEIMRYLEEQYEMAILDLKFATSDTMRDQAERDLKRVSDTACAIVGFKFADKLREKHYKQEGYLFV